MPCCKHYEGFSSSVARKHYAPDVCLLPVHMQIFLKVDIDQQKVSGYNAITIRQTSPLLKQTLTLNAVDMTIYKVEGCDSFQYDGKLLKVFFQQPLALNDEKIIKVHYECTKPITGLFFSDSYCVTDHETERARYWLPCLDFPTIKTTLHFQLQHLSKYKCLANGQFIKKTTMNNDWHQSEWRLDDYQCPSYLICVAIGDFIEYKDKSPSKYPNLEVAYFTAKPYTEQHLKKSFDKLPKMIDWLSDKLKSPFPWSKYYQIALPEVGGAMENISLITFNDLYLLDDRWALEHELQSELVTLHELAHTYFGNLLVIRHFEQVWLKESWATYMESIYLEEHYDRQVFQLEMYENAESYFEETKDYQRPIVERKYDSSWDLFDHHTYPGGCWRLHMLRHLLGSDIFWTGVCLYVEKYRNQIVETEDFRKCLEQVSGMNLTRFFEEFIYSKGYPKMKASYEYDLEKGMIKVTVEQQPANDDLLFFHLPIDLKVQLKNGQVILKTLTFEQSPKLEFQIESKEQPLFLELDPEMKILFQLEFSLGSDMLKHVIRNASLTNKIRAYGELIKSPTPSNVDIIKEAIEQESFYGIRYHVAQLLSRHSSKHVIQLLCQMLLNEKHPVAQFKIAKVLKVKDELVRETLLKFLDKDLPYKARELALENLGRQRHPADFSFLLNKTKEEQPDLHFFIKSGALKGLGHLGTQEAYDYLLNNYDKQPQKSKPAALSALANCCFWIDSLKIRLQTLEILRQTISSNLDKKCRQAAIEGLLLLQDKQSADLLEKSKWMYAEQEWPWLYHKVDELKQTGSKSSLEVKQLMERVEHLESRVRSLDK